MKNAIFNLAAIALFAVLLTSCKKDPSFSDQLVGHWKSSEVKAGSTDLTNSNTFDLNLQSTKEFDLDVSTIVPLTGTITKSYSGDWVSDPAKLDVTLTYNETGDSKTWEIIAIDDLNMTAELVENSVRYQVKFQKQ